MAKITITEALAEIPTIQKRIQKKREFIKNYLYRQSSIRDPHEKSGGSSILIEAEAQAVVDLENRLVAIRSAIQKSNLETEITIGHLARSVSDWLTWRREIAGGVQSYLRDITNTLVGIRAEAQRRGASVTDKDTGAFTQDIIVNINEKRLTENIEYMEELLGTLDGQLSLKNATTLIDVP